MSTATESCFTPEEVQGAGNCAIGCTEFQILTYPRPSRVPVYEPGSYYNFDDARARVADVVNGGIDAAVVEKVTTVTRTIILGPFEGRG